MANTLREITSAELWKAARDEMLREMVRRTLETPVDVDMKYLPLAEIQQKAPPNG